MAEGGRWRAGRGGGLGGGGKWESYHISMLLSQSLWGEHGHTCARFQV